MLTKHLSYVLCLTFSTLSLAQNHDHDHDHGHAKNHLTKSSVVLAGMTATKSFQKSFEQLGAKLGAQLVGFEAFSVEGEAEVSVFNIPKIDKLRSSEYDCHFHADGEGHVESSHCRQIENTESVEYKAAQESFSVQEFEDAASNSIAVFEKNINKNPELIKSAKFWRSYDKFSKQKLIQVKLTWGQNDTALKTSYLYCHYHAHHQGHGAAGEHKEEPKIDCHRQRSAGSHEPPSFGTTE